MGKEISGWVIVNKKGDILDSTYSSNETATLKKFIIPRIGTWEDWLQVGYRCVPCTIKINE